jgi:hypothetical protein
MSTGRLGAGDTAIQPTILDAKGDLIVATAADTPARLAVGSNDTVLTADSSTATGLKWAAPSAPSAVSCSVYNNAAQTLATGVYTTMTFNSEYYDTDNIHSTSSNTGRLTVPSGLGGKWLVTFAIYISTTTAQTITPKFQLNGNDRNRFPRTTFGSSEATVIVGTQTLDLVAGDYIELLVYQASGVNQLIDTSGNYGHFGMSRLGA